MQRAVMIEINGEPLYLRYDINSLIQGEQDSGINISSEQQLTFAVIRAMLYTGLLWNDKQMTLLKAGDILQNVFDERGVEEGSKYLAEKIKKANDLAFGKKLEAPQKKPQNQNHNRNRNKNNKKRN